jgi:competence protein ComEA
MSEALILLSRKGGSTIRRIVMRYTRVVLVLCLAGALFLGSVPTVWAQQEASKININLASADEIAQLKGIGPSYAERIIEYRETHGPFKSPDEITNVKGIGTKTFEANKGRITVD